MKKNTSAFANQLLICLLVTLCTSGSVGLGTVWVRHQISVTANTNRALMARIAEIERQMDEKSALIESEQTPDVLRRRNAEFALGLVDITDTQIRHVTDTPGQLAERLALRANRETFKDVAQPIGFQLALHR